MSSSPTSRKISRHPALERVCIGIASAILGRGSRSVLDLAARGELPGAAKIGGRWTFDLAKLRAYVREREQACHRRGTEHRRRIARTSTNAEKYGGAAYGSPAAK